MKNKKGAGLVGGIVGGIIGLVIMIILAYVLFTQLTGAGLLTANGVEYNITQDVVRNFSDGVQDVSSKIPTIFTVAAVVLILGVLVFLVAQFKRMQVGQGSL